MTDQRITTQDDAALRHIASLTALMRHKEAELAEIAERRRKECIRLSRGVDGPKVTYTRLAKAMGISDVAVYKILRKGGPPLREREDV